MAIPVTTISLCLLVGILAAAVYFDYRYHRIPNALTMGGALAGLLMVVQTDPSWQTLAFSFGGMALGIALFLPLYALGKMGAGDVKMLAMVGAYVGPIGVFWTSLWSLIAGGVLALLWLGVVFGVRQLAHRTLGTLVVNSSTRSSSSAGHAEGMAEGMRTRPNNADEESPLQSKMPYAAAIAVGAVIAARLQLVA